MFIQVIGRCSNCSWRADITRLKYSEISHISIYISTTKGAMANRMTALDSAHQIGLSTCLEDVLIVVGGSSSLDFKKTAKLVTFPFISPQQGALWQTGWRHWIQRIK